MALGSRQSTGSSDKLTRWIAQSSSWQSFIDFKLQQDDRTEFKFLKTYDSFFISLMTRAIELLKSSDLQSSQELVSLGKGLEIFSLKEKRTFFDGVDQSNNVLYSAGLYYLSNYSASSWILSKIYPKEDFTEEIDQFISNFLKRENNTDNRYSLLLRSFLEDGNNEILEALLNDIRALKATSFNDSIEQYFSCVLAESILTKFATDNLWRDLMRVKNDTEYWKQYVSHNIKKKVPVWSFFPSQKIAIEKGILTDRTCSLQMPTSAGKTSISELIIYDEFKKNPQCKILYLAPYRALASELKLTLARHVANMGISSKTIFGGNLPTQEEQSSVSEVNLLIATPEKFMAIEDMSSGISGTFTTIICDEGHLLDDESRGLSYELLLSRMKGESLEGRRFIFISAIIPNIEIVNKWLGGTADSLISSGYRPTELDYAFLKITEKRNDHYLDINPHKRKSLNHQLYKFLVPEDLKLWDKNKKKKKAVKTKKALTIATALKAVNSGTVAVFAPHKRGSSGVEGLAEEALKHIESKDVNPLLDSKYLDHYNSLVEYFTIVLGSEYLLTEVAKSGLLFHHGAFPQGIREIVEDSVRSSKVKLVICTNTLAEGVNLPIKTIVIHSTQRYNPDLPSRYEPLKIRDLKNLVGRAGRAGKETKGMVITVHEDDFERMDDLIKDRNIEPVKGQLYNIINLITRFLERRRLLLTKETLDRLSGELKTLLDSIDMSMIDLLAEEVDSERLSEIVSRMIQDTLSFYQASSTEKTTLNDLFGLRADVLKPIVQRGDFPILKKSGTNVRLFEEITEHFDFDDDIWNNFFDPLDDDWLKYLFDNGIFKLESFKSGLADFNKKNGLDLKNRDIKKAIKLWMTGRWYGELSEDLDIETHKTLILINSFLGFTVQGFVSGLVRVKQLNSPLAIIPETIANWSSYLQHGVSTQLQLNLVELGLAERLSVYVLSEHLVSQNLISDDYNALRAIIVENIDELNTSLQDQLPEISRQKLNTFLQLLRIQVMR